MPKSTTHANNVLNIIGSAATTAPAQTWISLHTATPGTTGASEVSTGSYARVRVYRDGSTSPFWGAAASAAMRNSGVVTFPQGGGSVTVTHFGVWDAATNGNFLRGGQLDAQFVYGTTVTPEFANNAITLTEA
jgi:hypothetical protein